jgi:DNA polymerase-3 subunit alpha
VLEAKRMGIPLLPPSLNRSRSDFSIERTTRDDGVECDGIRFGLAAVKNVGQGAIDAIIATRAAQPEGRFTSLDHLCRQVDSKVLNKRVLESLIKAGALDDFGHRAQLLEGLERALGAGQQAQRAREAGQISLFGLLGGAEPESVGGGALPDVEEAPRKMLLAWEKEMTGLYLSEHPLSLVQTGPGITLLGEITTEQAGQKATIVAMISAVRRIITKKNTTMGVMVVEDLSGTLELVAFPECFEQHADLWQADAIIRAVVKVDLRNDQVQLVCESAESFVQREAAEALDGPGGAANRPTVHLTLTPTGEFWRDVEQLTQVDGLLRHFEGDDPVVLHLDLPGGPVLLRAGRGVESNGEVERALAEALGPGAVRIEQPAAEDVYALTAD